MMEGAIAPAIAPATFECNNALSYLPLSELNTRYDRSSKQLVTNESHRTGWAGEQLSQLCTNINIILMMTVMVRSRQKDSLEVQNAKCTIHDLSNFITLYDTTLDIAIVIVQVVHWTE